MDFTGKALVTGASGFVGSAVARKLAERGLAVRALVRPGARASTSPASTSNSSPATCAIRARSRRR